MVILGLVLVALFSSSSGYPVDYNDCGYEYTIQGVDIDVECVEQPCYFYSGVPTNISVTFLSRNVVANDFNPSIFLVIKGSSRGLTYAPLKCPAGTCPVALNQTKTYRVTASTDVQTEPVRAEIHWEVYNQMGKGIICGYTPVILLNVGDEVKASELRRSLKNP